MRIFSKSVFGVYTNEYEEWFGKNRFAYLSELELLRILIPRHGRGLEVGIDKDSWLGEIYQAKKDKSKFYREARFYSARKIIELLNSKDFRDINVHRTIFNPPETLETAQHYRESSGEGGFAAICGRKSMSEPAN